MDEKADATQFDAGDEKVKFSDLFDFQRVLGNGSFGVVVAAFQRPYMKECAVKIIMKKTLRAKNLENFGKESQILQQLNHPNVVKFISIKESETRIFLVMEHVRGGRLQDLIEERNRIGKPITDEEASTIMRGIFAGLKYIHMKDIVHRDMKPENILLDNKDDLSSVKICDFGLSAQYNESTCTRSFNEKCGTDIFMAPELWKKKSYSKPVDMWSCGIIMYMLLSGGKHPLYTSGDTRESYFKKLEKAEWPMLPNFNRYSKNLFLKLVQEEPSERYSAAQIESHPWITRRFDEDFPLTSSEKIAAFSHSQIFSRIIKSVYLAYNLENSSKMLCQDFSQDSPSIRKQTSSLTRQEDSFGFRSRKSDEEIGNGFESDTKQKISTTGDDSPLIRIVIYKPPETDGQRSDFNQTEDATPISSDLSKKGIPSMSVQSSNIRGSLRQSRPSRDRIAVGSGMGSFAELETTEGSGPNSQQDEKNSQRYYIDSGLQVEPVAEENYKAQNLKRNTLIIDRNPVYARVINVSKRDSRESLSPEKTGYYPDKELSSPELEPKHEANRRSTSRMKGRNSVNTKNNHSSTANMESIMLGCAASAANMSNYASADSVGMLEKTTGDFKKSGFAHNVRTLANVSPEPMNNNRQTEDIRSLPDLQVGEFGNKQKNIAEKKIGPSEESQKTGGGKKKVRKTTVDATLLNLTKIKPRLTSLPMNKKENKDKRMEKAVVDPKEFSMTAVVHRPSTLGGDNVSFRNAFGARKIELIHKNKHEERKTEEHLENKQNPFLLTAYKASQKEPHEDTTALPLIKQEVRKIKSSWGRSTDRAQKDGAPGPIENMRTTFHRPASRTSKPITAYK